jgi:hypothetical protein
MRGLRGVGSGRMWAKLSGTYRPGCDAAQLRGGAAVPQRAHRRQSAQSRLATEGPVPDATQLLQPILDWTSNRALRRAILVDNPGAALRFSVRLNLCIHATLGELEPLNLLRGGKVRRQQQRHTDDGALRKIARRAQCNFGPLRNLARSEEFTRTSKVTPSR